MRETSDVRRKIALFAIGLLCAVGRIAAQSSTTEVPLGGGQRLVFTHPASWTHETAGPAAAPTLTLHGPRGNEFRLLITSLPLTNSALSDEKILEEKVRQAGEALLGTAEQKTLELIPVRGATAHGFVYHLTDRSPEQTPNDYREMRQGVISAGPVLLSVTLLTHPGDAANVAAGLETLAGVTVRKD